MRKTFFIIVLSILICCTGCILKNPYHGKRPSDYPNTKWVSKNPDIYFTVAKETIPNEPDMLGEIKVNNEVIPVQISFNTNNSISVLYYYEDDDHEYTEVFVGKCKFEKKKCIVTDLFITDSAKKYFSDDISKIIFEREELS